MQKGFMELLTPRSSLGFSGGGFACLRMQHLGAVKEFAYQHAECLEGKRNCTPEAET